MQALRRGDRMPQAAARLLLAQANRPQHMTGRWLGAGASTAAAEDAPAPHPVAAVPAGDRMGDELPLPGRAGDAMTETGMAKYLEKYGVHLSQYR